MEEDTRALIIVDVQPTFCEGGALGVEGGNAVAERIADFVTENADEYELLVTTQDWHVNPGSHFSDTPDFVDTWPEHGVAGTAEAELHEAIASLPLDASVKKGEYSAAYSGFEGKDAEGRTLEEILRAAGIQTVDVVGLAESHCVKETALDALRLGWRTRVLSDLTVPVSPETGEDARREMDEAGVEQIPTASAFGFYEEGEDAPIPGDFADKPHGDGSGFAGGELDDLSDLDDYDNLDDFDGLDDNLDVPSGGEAGAAGLLADVDGLADLDADDLLEKLDVLEELDDLEEDVDFSDEVDEADFDFSDIDFDPGAPGSLRPNGPGQPER